MATTYYVLRQCTSFYFVCFSRIGDFTWRVSDCEELVVVTHRGRWIWFYKVSIFKRIGKAGTKIKGIEENDNGQGNRSMVN